MVYGLWQSAGGMAAQQFRQAILANNLANAQTPGFKPDTIAFEERLSEARSLGLPGLRNPLLDVMTGGVFETKVYTNHEQGSIVPGGPLDVAILGDGFLTVSTSDGPRYTRDAQMLIDGAGTLVHAASGAPVLNDQGRRIELDPAGREPVLIDDRGYVRQGAHEAGRLAIVDFENRQLLEKQGHSLYASPLQKPHAGRGSVRQGAYEASAVEPITTMVDMMAATRAYEMNASMISLQDQSLGRAVNDVGRLG